MLGSSNVVSFVPSRDPEKARAFYEGVLGLTVVSEDPSALVLDANGVTVRIANVSSVRGFKPAPFTILGWDVPDIKKVVADLQQKGVEFERYEQMAQDETGVWQSPGGAKVAWFKDPEGNVLSLTEHEAAAAR